MSKRLARLKKLTVIAFVVLFPFIAAGLVAVYYAFIKHGFLKRLVVRLMPTSGDAKLARMQEILVRLLRVNNLDGFGKRFVGRLVPVSADAKLLRSQEMLAGFLREHNLNEAPRAVSLSMVKSARRLQLLTDGSALKTYRIGLGKNPVGRKCREGDRRTPVGEYYVCTRNHLGSFYLFLGISYPNKEDAALGLKEGVIDAATKELICAAIDARTRPPWDTPLGGEIGIHGFGAESNWTVGCVALEDADIAELWGLVPLGTPVSIVE